MITVVELLQEGNLIIARTFQPTPVCLAVAGIYWVISSLLVLVLRNIGRRPSHGRVA
ncbi:hypothetical protein [Deinococcus peraridilitoris]|uniref:hypothetical protein n=1 Tax=Deinococcus peraridilitoris TaxID=432329 RepID=UPI0002FE8D93|nr:hypothetical protein [Deinococcus peraridilitoris]